MSESAMKLRILLGIVWFLIGAQLTTFTFSFTALPLIVALTLLVQLWTLVFISAVVLLLVGVRSLVKDAVLGLSLGVVVVNVAYVLLSALLA